MPPHVPPRVTILSNGYGEDSIGTLLANELRRRVPAVRLEAYPTVDRGRAYEPLGIPILGPRKSMPSSGLLMHNLRLFTEDIRAGFLGMTGQQVQDLRRLETDVLIVVGDAYALLLSSLVQTRERYYVQSLVSAYHKAPPKRLNRLFMENVTVPERLLIRCLVKRMYVRDLYTRDMLQARGVPNVSALGNPMLDALKPEHGAFGLVLSSPVIALLPGTRRYTPESLRVMLETMRHYPEALGLIAWAGGEVPEVPEWRFEAGGLEPGLRGRYCREGCCVYLFEGRFSDILNCADLALGTSGTANEQAAGVGLPVVAFPVPPLYRRAFLENQQRLLSHALTVSEAEPVQIAAALRTLHENPARYAAAVGAGRERMGAAGGVEAIIEDILSRSKIALEPDRFEAGSEPHRDGFQERQGEDEG